MGNVEKVEGWVGKGRGMKVRGEEGRSGVTNDYGGSGGMDGVDGKHVSSVQ